MKKFIFLSILFLKFHFGFAQTFTNSTGGSIQEVNITNAFPLEVSGLPGSIDSSLFGLVSVCFDIHHSYDGDLLIKLQSPDGNEIILSNQNGDGGNNYTNTIFSSAGGPNIAGGAAPFTGTYSPEDPFSNLPDFHYFQSFRCFECSVALTDLD